MLFFILNFCIFIAQSKIIYDVANLARPFITDN